MSPGFHQTDQIESGIFVIYGSKGGAVMKNKLIRSLVILLALMMVLAFSGCSRTEEVPEEEPEEDVIMEDDYSPAHFGAEYGYTGDDPVEAEAYKYMVDVIAGNYEPADVSIPAVQIIYKDLSSEDEAVVYGDFWIFNYNIEGDTLMCVSGGNHPGVMHMIREGDEYKVTQFDAVEDGGAFDSSARDLYGDHYDDFMEVYYDSDAKEELRKQTISDYVYLNGLEVTKYQDEGWDPVELDLQ